MNLPKVCPNRRNAEIHLMKFAFVVVSIAFALFLSSCADQSLITDEEYRQYKGPAPHSPDYSGVLPGYRRYR